MDKKEIRFLLRRFEDLGMKLRFDSCSSLIPKQISRLITKTTQEKIYE